MAQQLGVAVFYYHLGLHYSQTRSVMRDEMDAFYYHLGLHYSQTMFDTHFL